MPKRVLSALLALSLAASTAGASAFNDVLPGARAAGMGTAFAAIADDAHAMFYNPAGTANTPYIQAGGTFGRLQSPRGPLFHASGVYLRPYEPVNTATVGAAYFLERQRGGGDIDSLLLNYAMEYKVRELPLSRPLKVGVNAKILNSAPGDGSKSKLALGFDAGVLARSNMGLSFGAALTDMVTSAAYPRPGITLATAYTWNRRWTVAGDFRVRGGLAEFFPGIEAGFHQGLLRVRAGKGLSLDGIPTMSFGLGVNFSPVILDIAASIPTAGLNRDAGGYQASFSYRFGAPSFTGQFVGQAAAQAEALRADLATLEDKQKTMSQRASAAASDKTVAESELRVLERRVREAQDQYRALLKRNDELEYRNAERLAELGGKPKPVRAPSKIKPKVPAWPKKHVVAAGDTLRTIAARYYGDANQWERIYDANRAKVERGLPAEGATLLIPEP